MTGWKAGRPHPCATRGTGDGIKGGGNRRSATPPPEKKAPAPFASPRGRQSGFQDQLPCAENAPTAFILKDYFPARPQMNLGSCWLSSHASFQSGRNSGGNS